MREIKFRGKRVDNGEWVYGFFVYDEEWAKAYIYNGSGHDGIYHSIKRYEVDPKTVGQFTGLKDKNGKEIYEGDIVELRNCDEDPSEISEVVFTDGGFVVSADFGEYDSTTVGWAMDRDYSIEVIGNIHENPELLKG